MRPRILIAGAGSLGSRYLEGLAAMNTGCEIWVFDVSFEALAISRQRFENQGSHGDHDVSYVMQLGSLPTDLDLAIIATTADVRPELVASLVSRCNIRYWIVEKVLAQSLDELQYLSFLLADKQAWVNTPRYQWALYRSLRAYYSSPPPIQANFKHFSGLACNAIHFVDFVCRWGGAEVVEVDTRGLDRSWFESKRKGFYEVNGCLRVNFSDHSELVLESRGVKSAYTISLRVDEDLWSVDEALGRATDSTGRLIKTSVVMQSDLTAPTVRAILDGQDCGLPTLEQSLGQHSPLISALIEHWNRCMSFETDRLPIT